MTPEHQTPEHQLSLTLGHTSRAVALTSIALERRKVSQSALFEIQAEIFQAYQAVSELLRKEA